MQLVRFRRLHGALGAEPSKAGRDDSEFRQTAPAIRFSTNCQGLTPAETVTLVRGRAPASVMLPGQGESRRRQDVIARTRIDPETAEMTTATIDETETTMAGATATNTHAVTGMMASIVTATAMTTTPETAEIAMITTVVFGIAMLIVTSRAMPDTGETMAAGTSGLLHGGNGRHADVSAL